VIGRDQARESIISHAVRTVFDDSEEQVMATLTGSASSDDCGTRINYHSGIGGHGGKRGTKQ
jgi:hypothetical protein